MFDHPFVFFLKRKQRARIASPDHPFFARTNGEHAGVTPQIPRGKGEKGDWGRGGVYLKALVQ